LAFKNIILEEKLSKKLKNSHENFSDIKVFLALISQNHEEIYREALRGRNFLLPFLKLLDNFLPK
jgi:hypothetical protein